MIRFLFLLMVLGFWGADPALAAKACREHAGVARCAEGHVVCNDGSLDKRFSCTTVTSKRTAKEVVKFKKRPDRGQILEPGEPPPVSTLEESRKALKE